LQVIIKLFPPLEFLDGQKIRQYEIEYGTTIGALLGRVEGERVFEKYGLESLLTMVDNRVVEKDYILKNGQIIEILLYLCGG